SEPDCTEVTPCSGRRFSSRSEPRQRKRSPSMPFDVTAWWPGSSPDWRRLRDRQEQGDPFVRFYRPSPLDIAVRRAWRTVDSSKGVTMRRPSICGALLIALFGSGLGTSLAAPVTMTCTAQNVAGFPYSGTLCGGSVIDGCTPGDLYSCTGGPRGTTN